MKLRSTLFVLSVFGVLAFSCGRVEAVTTPIDSIQQGTLILNEALSLPQGGIPPAVLDRAMAIAVFPNQYQTNVLNGAQMAEGTMVVRNPDGAWSNPAIVYLTAVTPGSVPGGLAKNYILIFQNRLIVDTLEAAPLYLGAHSNIEGGPLETPWGAGSNPIVPIYSYTFNGGRLNSMAPLESILRFDTAANDRLYGISGVTPAEIFTSKRIMPPVGAGSFKCSLAMRTNAQQAKQVCG